MTATGKTPNLRVNTVVYVGTTPLGRRYGWTCGSCRTTCANAPQEEAATSLAAHECPRPEPVSTAKTNSERSAAWRAKKKAAEKAAEEALRGESA